MHSIQTPWCISCSKQEIRTIVYRSKISVRLFLFSIFTFQKKTSNESFRAKYIRQLGKNIGNVDQKIVIKLLKLMVIQIVILIELHSETVILARVAQDYNLYSHQPRRILTSLKTIFCSAFPNILPTSCQNLVTFEVDVYINCNHSLPLRITTCISAINF